MAMQEFRVPTSYKVDVDTVDRSIEGDDRCCLS